MEKQLVERLQQRLEEILLEMKPVDNRMLESSKLLKQYKQSLKEYTTEIFGEPNKQVIDDAISELALYEAVIEATDGRDEIIVGYIISEFAKEIYRYESSSRDPDTEPLDICNDALRRATLYYFKGTEHNTIKPADKLHNELGKHIYNNLAKGQQGANSGCMVVFLLFTGSMYFVFNIIL